MKKMGNKRMPTPKLKLIQNPIPTSLFLVYFCKHTLVKKVSIVPAVSPSKNNRYINKKYIWGYELVSVLV